MRFSNFLAMNTVLIENPIKPINKRGLLQNPYCPVVYSLFIFWFFHFYWSEIKEIEIMEMVKESVRKCSHCGNNGHNSRTCSAGGKGCLKLFGVQILTEKEDEAMRKSLSMGNLQSCNIEHHHGDAGYLSDGLLQSRRGKRAHERKKGIHHSLSLFFLKHTFMMAFRSIWMNSIVF